VNDAAAGWLRGAEKVRAGAPPATNVSANYEILRKRGKNDGNRAPVSAAGDRPVDSLPTWAKKITPSNRLGVKLPTHEACPPDGGWGELTIAPDMLTLAEHILDSKAREFDPATFRDRYEEALLAHLKAKQAGAVPERRQTIAPHRVVNLMEALRRSVAEDTKSAAPRQKMAAAPARKRA
jgi:hypothetical protein